MRVDLDDRKEKLGYKIREAQLEKVPYVLVLGDQEVSSKEVSIRKRGGETLPSTSIEAFIDERLAEVKSHR